MLTLPLQAVKLEKGASIIEEHVILMYFFSTI